MESNRIVGENLKNMRESLGYTQEEISKALNINRSAYSNYESGIREIPYDVLEKAADFFGCESYMLFEESIDAQNEILATAFRLNGLADEDYAEIIHFKDIVKTALKLNRIAAQ